VGKGRPAHNAESFTADFQETVGPGRLITDWGSMHRLGTAAPSLFYVLSKIINPL
jgi:hypothetical protein